MQLWCDAVRAKLLMLVAPFLRRWNYTRVLEQVRLGRPRIPAVKRHVAPHDACSVSKH
jgi:hypothetical protein